MYTDVSKDDTEATQSIYILALPMATAILKY